MKLTRKRVIVCAALFILAAAVTGYCIRWKRLKSGSGAIEVVTEANLDSRDRKFSSYWILNGWGYPEGDGKALFWALVASRPQEYALVSLPDWRVLCSVRGVDGVVWLPGGKAVAVAKEALPFAELPIARHLYGMCGWSSSYKTHCFEIDWRAGTAKPLNIAGLPQESRPRVTDVNIPGTTSNTLPPGVVAGPFVPEAAMLGNDCVYLATNPATNNVAVVHYDTVKKVRTYGPDVSPALVITPIALTRVGPDQAIAASGRAPHIVTLSTGAATPIMPPGSDDSNPGR
jgi:hypothetical protein